jgi:hypothetical protein
LTRAVRDAIPPRRCAWTSTAPGPQGPRGGN